MADCCCIVLLPSVAVENAALLKAVCEAAGGVTVAVVGIVGLVACSCEANASLTIWNNTLIN